MISSLEELQRWLPGVSSLDQLLARGLEGGRVPLFVEFDGRVIPTLPMLGQSCGIGFGRVAGPFAPRPGQRALDQPFMAGEAPVVLITLSEREPLLVDLKELEAMDGLQVVQLPELGGMTMYAFVGFAGERPIGTLATSEAPERGWPRLHQIEAIAMAAGRVTFAIGEQANFVTRPDGPPPPPFLLSSEVRMRPTVVEPALERWPGVGVGFRLAGR